MKRLIQLALFLSVAVSAFAGDDQFTVAPVPEIDANFAASAVALVSGSFLILRSRRKK